MVLHETAVTVNLGGVGIYTGLKGGSRRSVYAPRQHPGNVATRFVIEEAARTRACLQEYKDIIGIRIIFTTGLELPAVMFRLCVETSSWR